ncbi:hypothetical protein LRP52_49730, partial [Photobacterium sp. ZSDE20]|nr:hypothetical protein [Photobacterium sp. ZSDE20]
ISSGFTYANIITDLYSVEYRMGANESRQSAREGAIAQITEQAVTKMGSHIIVTKALDGDQYSESVDMLGASLLKVNIISDSIADKNSHSVLTVKAEVSLDEAELEKRLARIDADQKASQTIDDLSKQNIVLRRKLNTLQARKRDDMTHMEVARLENEQREILLQLEHLRENSKVIFEPGYLLKSARIKQEHEQAIKQAQRQAEQLLEQAKWKAHGEALTHAFQEGIDETLALNDN